MGCVASTAVVCCAPVPSRYDSKLMLPIRLLLLAVVFGIASAGCSRGPQGDPRDAEPVRALIERLDAEEARLQQLFELRGQVQRARAQLETTQQELAEDFPEIAAAGSIEATELPPPAQPRVRAFRASVAEYDRLVAHHNELAQQLDRFLTGRSPQEVRRLMGAMHKLRTTLTDMLEDADYNRAIYMARHSELVQALDLQSP